MTGTIAIGSIEKSRISLSFTLGNHMSSIRETSITKSRSSNNSSYWWVVDKRSGGTDHPGGAGKDGRISISITLGNHVSSIRITSITSIWETSIPSSNHSRSSNDRPDWWVVDERGGGTDHPGGAGKDGRISISRPLAIVAKSVISNSDRDSVSSYCSGNFSWSLLHTLDNWDMGDSMSSSKRESSNWETSITQTQASSIH